MSIPGTISPQPDSPTRSVPRLSVVTSVYRSEKFIPAFIDETVAAIRKAHIEHYEIIFVNDGSPDDSLRQLLQARTGNPSIKIVDLSRNFGHHKAIMAGLGFYPDSTDGLIKAENSRSRRATLRRMRGLWNRSR